MSASSTRKEIKKLLSRVSSEFRIETRGTTHVFVYSPNGVDIAHGSLAPGSPKAVGTFKQRLRSIGALPEEA